VKRTCWLALALTAASPKLWAGDSSMSEGLREALLHTPYSALVVHTKVDVLPVPDEDPNDDLVEERHVYHARVIETFRGSARKRIRYEMIVEKGEPPVLSKAPEIVALCDDEGRLYWPGVGTSFPGKPALVAQARKTKTVLTASGADDALCR
jgi:hypothetical protein